jgi:HD-GYP domain-containing protein (c-di-GMP phosphodiesterase class II)
MAQRRVGRADLAVGRPLPWDVYDVGGQLLLSKGHRIDSEEQLERLIAEGMFVKELDSKTTVAMQEAAAGQPHPSALKALLEAREHGAFIARRYRTEDCGFARRIEHSIELIQRACDINPDVALATMQLRQDSSYAVRHQVDVAVLALLLAREMALSPADCRAVVGAALTMNLAMVEVQDKLDSLQGELVPAMRHALLDHPRKSVEWLEALGVQDQAWLTIVAQHHERADGSGYPAGLNHSQIVPGAAVVALADRYCARICRHGARPWRLPPGVLGEIYNDRGLYADEEATRRLVKLLGPYPAGTMVRLASQEIGIVTHSVGQADHPMVHALLDARGIAYTMPLVRHTARSTHAIKEALDPARHNVRVQMFALWGKGASETERA